MEGNSSPIIRGKESGLCPLLIEIANVKQQARRAIPNVKRSIFKDKFLILLSAIMKSVTSTIIEYAFSGNEGAFLFVKLSKPCPASQMRQEVGELIQDNFWTKVLRMCHK